MFQRFLITSIIIVSLCLPAMAVSPLSGLMERIDSGLSGKIKVTVEPDTVDYFELSQDGVRPEITANNYVSAAMGLNYYLKYTAGVHLSWNCMSVALPDTMPPVKSPVRMSTSMPLRYYLNYCTHSYSMAFWDWARWEHEIDWMALHGINMPLAITGTETVWRNTLRRLGYPDDKIAGFVAGPAFQAWWLMNNLEGWGGPNTDEYYERQIALQRLILGRMREFGMEPVLPGYSGMIPHDAASVIGIDVADSGNWLGFVRPAFVMPGSDAFQRVAKIYYEELTGLYGKAHFYSMDPFHEGGNTDGIDLGEAGKTIFRAMREGSPGAVWVLQAWQENPRVAMLDSLSPGDVVLLDLQAENRPVWNLRPELFGNHDWLYCMLLNFGGNVGLFGKLHALIKGYEKAAASSRTLSGIGLTMEGIENNPVMYELICELPWMNSETDGFRWLSTYAKARYGKADSRLDRAWQLLGRSVYACADTVVQQGTVESVFCARPADKVSQVSAWANSKEYYNPDDVVAAARLMASAADDFAGNANFEYDFVDVVRQAVADRGRAVLKRAGLTLKSGDRDGYSSAAGEFLHLIDLQDSLLGTLPDFRLGRWLDAARGCGDSPQEKERWEWNARVQITTWGHREASDAGELHDYAHREWQGLLRDFYKPRWQRWFDERLAHWGTESVPDIDFYSMEETWTRSVGRYSPEPEGEPVAVARYVLSEVFPE